jgi:hypothetical protein
MSSSLLEPSLGPATRTNREPVLSRALDALATVAFVTVGAIVLIVGGALMASLEGYKSAWESFCQRDYAVGAIWAACATVWSAVGLSLLGLGIWGLIELRAA